MIELPRLRKKMILWERKTRLRWVIKRTRKYRLWTRPPGVLIKPLSRLIHLLWGVAEQFVMGRGREVASGKRSDCWLSPMKSPSTQAKPLPSESVALQSSMSPIQVQVSLNLSRVRGTITSSKIQASATTPVVRYPSESLLRTMPEK